MKYIQLTTRQGGKVTIFISSNANLAVCVGVAKEVTVLDGLHNNGGWQVTESYEEVIAMIQAAYFVV
jgi:hypothetical protein